MNKGLLVLLLIIGMVSLSYAVDLDGFRYQNKIYIDNSTIFVNEPVKINAFTKSKEISIVITKDEKKYTLLEINGDALFTPKSSGFYDVKLVNLTSKKIIDQNNFTAISKPKIIYTNKKNYSLSEYVKIFVPGFEENERIIINSSFANYVLISPSIENNFKPKIVGTYNLLYFKNNTLVTNNSFEVFDKFTAKNQNNLPKAIQFLINLMDSFDSSSKKINFLKMTDARGLSKNVEVKFFDRNNKLENPIENRRYRAEIKPGIVEKIELENLRYNHNINLKIDKIAKEKIDKIKSRGRIVDSFAIDPSQLDFSNGTVTKTAQGNLVYKCKKWDFINQVCSGKWSLIQKINPGQQYFIKLSANDPAYVETGLASVNTNKSIYFPNENVKIIIVVLDSSGFLVKNANVTLDITSPIGSIQKFSTVNNSIVEVQRGIYEVVYQNTSLEGDYSLFVSALADNVNDTMVSFFRVKNNFEFDILRTIPATTDPFSGPFISKIKVISYNTTTFNLSERLPLNFTVSNSNGASIGLTSENIILTWSNLLNNSMVSYVAYPPLITPELWEIGPAFIYSNDGLFKEIKPWYLAIDPISESSPTDNIDTNRIGTNNNYAYDQNLGSYASMDIDGQPNPDYVIFFGFNISEFNNESAINELNITYSVATRGTFSNDNWYLEYSTNGGSGWSTCYSADGTGTSLTNITCAVSISSWTFQTFKENFRVRVGGDRDNGADGVTLDVYEIWATITYPLGTLNAQLISPINPLKVAQYNLFNFTAQITCTVGDCGNVQAFLDPLSGWWNNKYQYRKKISITNNDGLNTMYKYYTYNLTADTTGANYQDDGDDFRIVWWNETGNLWTEIDRINVTGFNSATTQILFRLQEDIAPSTSNSNYYIYYGNDTVTNPPNNESNVYFFVERFERGDSSTIGNGWTEWQGGATDQVSIVNGKLTVGGNNANGPDVGVKKTFGLGELKGDFIFQWDWNIQSNVEGNWLQTVNIGNGSLMADANYNQGVGPGLYTGEGEGMPAQGTEPITRDVTTTTIETGITGTYAFVLITDKSAATSDYYRGGNLISSGVAWTNNIPYLNQIRIYSDDYIATEPDFTYDNFLIYLKVGTAPTDNFDVQEQRPKGIISTTPGDLPFWTLTNNPMNSSQNSCLADMNQGDSCNTTWVVNATGNINSIWEFFVNYSSLDYGDNISAVNTSRVNITIIGEILPEISDIECQENGITWSICSNVQYNDLLTGFRAKCSYSLSDPIDNVTFTLNNVEDGGKIIYNYTTDNSTGYYVLNFSSIPITDSGTFFLNTTCSANPTAVSLTSWFIPFGSPTITLLPLTNQNINVTQNQFFTFNAQINCTGGECGDINSSLWYRNNDDSIKVIEFIGFEDGATEEAKWIDNAAPSGSLSVGSGNDWTARSGSNALALSANIQPFFDYWFRNISLAGYRNVNITMYSSSEDTETADDYEMYYWNGTNYILMWNETARNGGSQTSWTRWINSIPDSATTSDFRIQVGWSTSAASEHMILDDVNITGQFKSIDYLISMVSGITPFWTSYANPKYPKNTSCLANMNQGDSCNVKWIVNATGGLDTIWSLHVKASAINYSANISQTNSSIINVTIINNTIPHISVISISPDYPETFHNLNCSFTVIDPNIFDNLYVNITWFKNSAIYSTKIINMTAEVENSDLIDSNNTAIGESWYCSVTPYDNFGNGNTKNSTSVTITADAPPIINSIECQENNAIWGSCDIIDFNDELTKVRTNCTDSQQTNNATFRLFNYPDNNSFFDITTSSKTGDYYTLDIADILIRDSGEFNLTVICTDNSSNSRTKVSNWSVPWGTLIASLSSPNTDVDVSQGIFFTWTSTVQCSGGECGNINASLDPHSSGLQERTAKPDITILNPQSYPMLRGNWSVLFNTTGKSNLTITVDDGTMWSKSDTNGTNTDLKFLDIKCGQKSSDYDWITNRFNQPSVFVQDYECDDISRETSQVLTSGKHHLMFEFGESSAYAHNFVSYVRSGGTTGPSFTFDIGSPNNRLVVIFADDESNGNYLTGVTVDGNACNFIVAADNSVGVGNHQELWYCDEDDFGSSNSLVTIAISGGDTGWGVHAHLYTGIDQSGPYDFQIDDTSQSQVEILPAAIDIPVNGLLVFGAANGQSGSYIDANWDTNPTEGPDDGLSPEIEMTEVTDSPNPTSAVLATAYWISSTSAQTNRLFRASGSRTNNRGTGIIASWNLAHISKGLIPMIYSTPFYTTTANSMFYTNTSCLQNMTDGDLCTTSWEVNTTGSVGSIWEFFAYYSGKNYAKYIIANETTRINLTIVTNTFPNITSINLLPIFPTTDDDLNCTFTIEDAEFYNHLNANVTWYKNNIISSSTYLNITNGVQTIVSLGSLNTSIEEVWHCQVIPFDNLGAGTGLNSTQRTIATDAPPTITDVMCQVENTAWINCNSLFYGQNITAVRANCSDDLKVENVSFYFYNLEDNRTYFNNLSTYNISERHIFNNSDIYLSDSGNFYFNATCNDNSSHYDLYAINWSIDWGTLTASLVNPSSDTNVEKNSFFNFISSVTCLGGECGDVNASLDPRLQNIQSDEFNFAGTSGTDTIPNAVTMNKTILFSTIRQNEADPSDGNVRCRLSSATGIACNRYTSNNPIYMRWYVAQFYDGIYVQRQSSAQTATTTNVGINSIILNKSFVVLGGRDHAGSAWGTDDFLRARLTSQTNLELAISGGSGGTVDWQVVEYNHSFVQRDIVTLSAGSGTVTDTLPTSVNENKSFLLLSYYSSGGGPDIGERMILGRFTNNNTLEFTRNITTSDNYIAWEVIEMKDNSQVRHGISSFGSGVSTANVDFEAINSTRSVAFASTQNSAGSSWGRTVYSGNDIPGVSAYTFKIINNTRLQIVRSNTLDAAEVYWQVVEFDDGLKHGLISMVSGATPFYTTDANPMNPTNESCLANLSAGTTCQLTWQVNATGELNTTHKFFVDFNPTTYINNLIAKRTSAVYLTIADSSLVPPIVTLISPDNDTYTSNNNINFTCEATDNSALVNLSLYADFSGTFGLNETVSVGGSYANHTFNKTLQEGLYIWNCRAFDSDNNDDEGSSNRTIIVDQTAPTINLTNPQNLTNFVMNDINFSWTTTDALSPTFLCNLSIKSSQQNYSDKNILVINNTEITRTIAGMLETEYTWNVTCADRAGNYNTSLTYLFTIANTPPTVTLVTLDGNWFNSENVTLNYNTTDNEGIVRSDLYLNGIYNKSDYTVTSTDSFNLTNLLEGNYTWRVNATDTGNLTNLSQQRTFYVDYTAPWIIINYPAQNISLNLSLIDVNFTAIDNMDSTMDCNITLNNVIAISIDASNNTEVIQSLSGLTDGLNYWNITCVDDAGNYNTSKTRTINVSAPPTVILNSPEDNHSQSINAIYLNYTPSDNSLLQNCELILNNFVNATEPSPIKDTVNSFFLEDLNEGKYIWSVNCTDMIELNSMSKSRVFYIDLTPPNVSLFWPDNDITLITNFVIFNFTATDNLDPIMLCNITVDGNKSAVTDILALNGSVTTSNKTMTTEGIHWWNVTCQDDSGNWNISETRNFTLRVPPLVTLLTPSDNYATNISSINFTYYTIDESGLANASFILNGVINQTEQNPTNDFVNNFTLVNLAEGIYNWTVNVTDLDNLTTSAPVRWFTIDTKIPVVQILRPLNHTTVTTNNFTLEFYTSDNLDDFLTCNLYYGGVLNITNISVANNTNFSTTKLEHDGNYNWSVNCYDNVGNINSSGTIFFDVIAPPIINLIYPINYTRTKYQNVSFEYVPYDDFGFENCSIFVDDIMKNTSESVYENVPNYNNLSDISNGVHNWTIECVDAFPDLNTNKASEEFFIIDLYPPYITLNQPYEGEVYNTDDVLFNWTATDNFGINLLCNLTVDNVINKSDISSISGNETTFLIENLSLGLHNYTIICWDDLNWTNSSNLTTFIVNAPDLTFNESNNTYLTFNNSAPSINESITISAIVFNKGGYPAFNVLIEFWDGIPQTGVFMGNYTITQLDPNLNITVNITWNITDGMHEVWAILDPYELIVELDDSNNNVTKNISVLISEINYPLNLSWTNNLTNEFIFRGAGYISSNVTYNVFVDGTFNGENGTIPDNSTELINITLSEGLKKIEIEVNDTNNRSKNSTPIYIYVDRTVPTITFQTLNNTWFNESNALIQFVINDNLDELLNYTLYLNGVPNITSVANRTIQVNNTIENLTDGTYYINLTTYDNAGNQQNSSLITIYIDTKFPYVDLNFPENDYNFTYSFPELNFTAYDNMDAFLVCNLTINNSIYLAGINSPNNSVINITVNSLNEDTYSWNITCYDNATNTNTSETRWFNYFTSPVINLTNPEEGNWINIENVTFYFNASDTTGLENCSILLNGIINQTKWNENLTNYGKNNFTINYLNGTYNWSVKCYDNSSFNIRGVSENRTLYVDIEKPQPHIETANNTWFNINNPFIFYNITDNMDSWINFTFLVDDLFNKFGIAQNGQQGSSNNLNAIIDGIHELKIEAKDEAGNRKNSTPITFYIDTVAPYIDLTHPEHNNVSSNTTMFFNFTAFDTTSINLSCDLVIDGIVQAQFNTTNATYTTGYIENLDFKVYYWNVTCTDMALNVNTSETRNFTIPAPDLTLNSNDILFNESNPKEGSNITINATIHNFGETTALNIFVEFWDSNWTDGNQIKNLTVNNITSNSSYNILIDWETKLGRHDIYVVIDPPLATNGTIKELNETNNYAFNSISIIFWHYFFGNVTGNLIIGPENNSVFEWTLYNYNTSNVFAADSDNSINWLSLKEIGINSTNETELNDFEELDIALNSTKFSDSINKTYLSQNQPVSIKPFIIFGSNLTNVSVANSTNTSNFVTGILWDSSQGSEFNGTQDIIFITEVKKMQGSYGFYDYEIRVPATLREYKGTTNSVSFYTELK